MTLWTIILLMLTPSSGYGVAVKFNDSDMIVMEHNDNITGNSNISCPTDSILYDNECITEDEYVDMIADYLRPTGWSWLLIIMHIAVFICGIVGNSLVCVAVHRNHTMRTVTNYFIVNLAIADLMVIIFCLPASVLWDFYETWFLGNYLCKTILYLQTVSVSVSILTLTFISIDRWYAICFPLSFKSTTRRAKKTIIFIWIFSLLFDFPDLIVLRVVPADFLKVETIFFTQCEPSWGLDNERIFGSIKLVCLYIAPLIFMTFAYSRIIRVLWKSEIPGYTPSRSSLPVTELTSSVYENLENQLGSRRKAAKMLVAVVLVFGFCYFPVHLLMFLRQFVGLPSNPTTVACSLVAHWLCYANSAINPVIYNFMSGKFRKEFRRSFYCSSQRSFERDNGKFTGPTLLPDPRSQNSRHIHNYMNLERIQRATEIIPLSEFSRKSILTHQYS